MKRIVIIGFLFSHLISNAQNQRHALDSIVDVFRMKYNVPAIAASVVLYDTVFFGVSGLKRSDQHHVADLESKFHLGSNTKAITSTIAAILVEKGIIKWDTKLVEVVPELKTKIMPEYMGITLEQLLSHRARIQPFEDDTSKEWRNIPKSINDSDKDQKMAFVNYALNINPATFEKENHIYSNGGYIIASLLMEIKSGKSWETLLKELFAEINIDSYVGFPSQEDANSNYGHKKSGKKYKVILPDKEFPLENYFAPAGNLSMNIIDFSKFIQLHLRGLMSTDNYISKGSYQKMHYGLEEYSLGWYNGNIGETEQKFSYHGGSLGTYSSAVIISADRKVAIVILVNADNDKVNQLKNELRIHLWEKYGTKNDPSD